MNKLHGVALTDWRISRWGTSLPEIDLTRRLQNQVFGTTGTLESQKLTARNSVKPKAACLWFAEPFDGCGRGTQCRCLSLPEILHFYGH
ncbi:hypothetical protein KCP69_15165 [Salmonella enterica subsp. enterica]|nr:hypothetical protein KCP69_15165 [Salmonella enterica subsp. enterica]